MAKEGDGTMRTIDVRYEHEANGTWSVYADGVDGGYSFGRSVREAREMIREAVALVLDIDTDGVEIGAETFVVPGELGDLVAQAQTAKAAAEAAQVAQKRAVDGLRDAGLTVRDTGEVLGVTYQRVQQITGRRLRGAAR